MEYPVNEPIEEKEDSGLNIKFIIFKLLSNWYWFALTFVVMLSLAFFYLTYATKQYRISAKLLINDTKSSSTESESDILSNFGLFSTQSNVNNEVQILKSKTLLYNVIKDLQLNVIYFGAGDIKKTDVYKLSPFNIKLLSISDRLAHGQIIEYQLETKNGKVYLKGNDTNIPINFNDTVNTKYVSFIITRTNIPFKEGVDYGMDIMSYNDAYAQLLPLFTIVVTNEDVTTIDLSVTSDVQARGEDMLNKLIEVYIKSNVDENNRIADSTIVFIDSRLVGVQRELNNVEQQIEAFKTSSNITDITAQSQLLINTNADLQKQLSENSVQLQVTDMLTNYLADENNKRIMPTTVSIADPAFVTSLDKYNSLVLQRETILQSTTPDNPVIKSIDQQLAILRSDLLKILNSYKGSLSLKEKELESKNNQVNGYIKKVPAQQKLYLEYSRQQDIKQQLYLYLLQKREETAISRFNNVAPVRILDKATSDALPFSPNKMVTLTSAVLLAFFIPVGVIFGKRYFNNKILSEEDVAKVTKAPVVAHIGQKRQTEQIVVKPQSRSIIAEQFRGLRSNLQFMLGDKGKVIMITSSMSNEGKSFISLNLSSVLAISNKRVLLLELDLRKPKISKYLDIENTVGFSNYIISSDLTLKDVIKPSGINDNWWILNSGTIPPNPAELLMNKRMQDFMEEARQQFDFIIIDTPPIGLVSDAQTLAGYADVTLFIVRQKYTLKYQAHMVEDMRITRKIKNIGIVLNDVKREKAYGYGYTYRYGYNYGYNYGYTYGKENGNYYTDANEDKNFFNRIKSIFKKG